MPEVSPLFGNATPASTPKPLFGGGVVIPPNSVPSVKSLFDTNIQTKTDIISEKKVVSVVPLSFKPEVKPPEVNSLFATGFESNEAKAHRFTCEVLKNQHVSVERQEKIKECILQCLVKGVQPIKYQLEIVGRVNVKINENISDYNLDYDKLEIRHAIENTSKLITGKKGFFERAIEPNDVLPHLESIHSVSEGFLVRLEAYMKQAIQIQHEIKDLEYILSGVSSFLKADDLTLLNTYIQPLKLSAVMLIPNIEILQKEAVQQFEDVKRLVMVAIPTWKSAQKKR